MKYSSERSTIIAKSNDRCRQPILCCIIAQTQPKNCFPCYRAIDREPFLWHVHSKHTTHTVGYIHFKYFAGVSALSTIVPFALPPSSLASLSAMFFGFYPFRLYICRSFGMCKRRVSLCVCVCVCQPCFHAVGSLSCLIAVYYTLTAVLERLFFLLHEEDSEGSNNEKKKRPVPRTSPVFDPQHSPCFNA